MRFRSPSIAGIILCLAAPQMQSMAADAGAGVQVPPVHGTVLAGQKVELPDALRGKAGVLVIGFSESSRGEVASWGKRLANDYRGSDTVTYYEIAELSSVPRFLRGIVVKRIKDSVPDRAQGRFLPVFDHEADWKAATAFSKPDDAYVLVVDGGGTVRWRTEGIASDVAFAELERRVDAARRPASQHRE